MINETDRLAAMKSFRKREQRMKSERSAFIFLAAAALAEILAAVIFVIH